MGRKRREAAGAGLGGGGAAGGVATMKLVCGVCTFLLVFALVGIVVLGFLIG